MRLFAAALALVTLTLSPADAARPPQFTHVAPAEGALALPPGSEAGLVAGGAKLDAASRDAAARAPESANFEYKRNAVSRSPIPAKAQAAE
jgi:hypothetical protein